MTTNKFDKEFLTETFTKYLQEDDVTIATMVDWWMSKFQELEQINNKDLVLDLIKKLDEDKRHQAAWQVYDTCLKHGVIPDYPLTLKYIAV